MSKESEQLRKHMADYIWFAMKIFEVYLLRHGDTFAIKSLAKIREVISEQKYSESEKIERSEYILEKHKNETESDDL